MTADQLLRFLGKLEPLKSYPRHCWTSVGIRETVAAHSWRISMFALLLEEEIPDVSFGRVLRMCILHDIGEAVTGDIPVFFKTETDRSVETEAVHSLLDLLPEPQKKRLAGLFQEMDEQKTREARLYKALDQLEAVMQHNECDLSTWIPLEYTLNQTYGAERASEFPILEALQKRMAEDTRKKIEEKQVAEDRQNGKDTGKNSGGFPQ
ncbi:MAG: HD domain-containing protein [Oscillospiraceae bacterium]|nr:HD domain-containing protein [Oscillospiraceae bacterium]